MQEIFLVGVCYLLGAIPFSYISVRMVKGFDIRRHGSGNVGSTNVLRTAGKGVALAALTGDLLKGVLAAWLGLHFGGEILASICATTAVVGHCWSVFLGFRGGKGVATSAGVMLFLMPKVFLVLLIVFIITVAISRYVSLASTSVAALFPLMAYIFYKPDHLLIMSFALAVLVIYQHRENISRLRNGTEGKIGR